jgi:glycosyltransferase involved in cell wall biosynthesis
MPLWIRNVYLFHNRRMEKHISVIIPNYNGSCTVGKCLEAVFSSTYHDLEVVVVDDGSADNSVEIIQQFPCKLIQLNQHAGASKARNVGAQNSRGEVLFFIDADCIMQEHTVAIALETLQGREHAVVGGTYTLIPYDDTFFSAFQSVFIHYSETRKREPDYVATHAMAIYAKLFREFNGFREDFLPILEDVEFSHRLRRLGHPLLMNPDILVQHVFNFTLWKSLKNAFRKSLFWTIYSLKNRDILGDSGTASRELKVNVCMFLFSALSIIFIAFSGRGAFLLLVSVLFFLNLYISRGLVVSFHHAKGLLFGIAATLYYTMIYPLAVGLGGAAGIVRYLLSSVRG